MSAKNETAEKQEKKKVFIDFPSALMKLKREMGVKKTLGSVAEESGFSRVSVKNWETEAPPVVAVIYYFLKDNPGLTFEDLVKEVH